VIKKFMPLLLTGGGMDLIIAFITGNSSFA